MPTVLVVDDDPLFRSIVSTIAASAGWTVLEACDLRTSIPPLPEASVVVLDLNLPDAQGFAAVHRIREHSAIPIIVLTGDGPQAIPGVAAVLEKTTLRAETLRNALATCGVPA